MKITVTKNGPYIVTGGVPLIVAEICNDNEGYCRTWKTITRFPVQQEYARADAAIRRTSRFAMGRTGEGPV